MQQLHIPHSPGTGIATIIVALSDFVSHQNIREIPNVILYNHHLMPQAEKKHNSR